MNIFEANTEALAATDIYHKEKKIHVYYNYFKINYKQCLQHDLIFLLFCWSKQEKGRIATLLSNETTKRAAATGHFYSWGEMS